VLVAVDGKGAAGKSTFARALEAVADGQVLVVEMDDFFRPSAERPVGMAAEKPVGADFDWQRLGTQVLTPLRAGRPARYQRYDWGSDRLAEWHEVAEGGVVVVEGVTSARRELRSLYDAVIWVDAGVETRLRRGLERDGHLARSRWVDDWMPAEDRYASEHQTAEAAWLRVSGESD
jgi:uridine kinase